MRSQMLCYIDTWLALNSIFHGRDWCTIHTLQFQGSICFGKPLAPCWLVYHGESRYFPCFHIFSKHNMSAPNQAQGHTFLLGGSPDSKQIQVLHSLNLEADDKPTGLPLPHFPPFNSLNRTKFLKLLPVLKIYWNSYLALKRDSEQHLTTISRSYIGGSLLQTNST